MKEYNPPIVLTIEEAKKVKNSLASLLRGGIQSNELLDVREHTETLKLVDDKLKKALCDQVVFALVGSEELVSKWWNSPNKAFDLISADMQWKKDREVVINYLMDQISK